MRIEKQYMIKIISLLLIKDIQSKSVDNDDDDYDDCYNYLPLPMIDND